MARHESLTEIPFDPIMVFPQGNFSRKAMEILKRSGFIGAVNTEVISSDPQPHTITVGDYWNTPVMNYCSFPHIHPGGTPAQRSNFAFDILLGKPWRSSIVVRRDDCHEHGMPLAHFIDALNSLNARLSWCSLGETVRRSYRQRESPSGEMELEMYGSELRVENSSAVRKRFRIRRRETDPAVVKEIRDGALPIEWRADGDRLTFEIELDPGKCKTVRIVFTELRNHDFRGESLRYRVKAMLRRYLSELRDNYVSRAKRLRPGILRTSCQWSTRCIHDECAGRMLFFVVPAEAVTQ